MRSLGFRSWLSVLTLLTTLLVLGGRVVRQEAAVQSGGDPSIVGQWGPLIMWCGSHPHAYAADRQRKLMFGYEANVHLTCAPGIPLEL
jgi:hypothetical protein